MPFSLNTIPALSSWTMSIWVKPTTLPGDRHNGVIFGAAYYAGAAIYWRTNGGTMNVFGYIRGMDAYRSTPNYPVTIGEVYNFTLVNDRSDNLLKLYVNGVLVATRATATQEYNPEYIPIAGNIGIGKRQVAGGGTETYSFLNGNVYSALMYSRALTNQEVQQNFDALRERFTP